jgi:hypothetical protein
VRVQHVELPLSIIEIWKEDLLRLEAAQAARGKLAPLGGCKVNTFYLKEIERARARIEDAVRRSSKHPA